MANLTLKIDDEVLRRARVRALEEGTSVNSVVRRHLERFASGDRQRVALDRVLAEARRSQAGSHSSGRTWRRDDLYDRP